MHQCGIFFAAYVALTDTYFVPQKQCLIWQTIPLVGFVIGQLLPLLIGVDRMLCYFCPIM